MKKLVEMSERQREIVEKDRRSGSGGERAETCQACGSEKEMDKLSRCKGCASVYYCDKVSLRKIPAGAS
jgi:hypothetical protein